MEDTQRLIDAAGSGELEVLEELLENGVDPSADDNEAIITAAIFAHTAIVDRLLAWEGANGERVNPAADDNAAIREAADLGHTDVVDRLLRDNRVDPGAMDNYAIRVAAENGHKDVVESLLANDRVNPGARDNIAIRMAAANNHPKVLELFLKLDDDRVDPGAANNIAIGDAADKGFLEVVQLLLRDKRVNASQFENNFAIREAANEGHTKVVQSLLNWKGANGERVDPRVNDNEAICNSAADENFAIIVANAVLKNLLAAAYVQLNIYLSNNEYFLYNERDRTFTFLYRQVDLPPEFASTAIEFNRVIELSKGIQAGYQEFLEKKELKEYPTNEFFFRTAEERQQKIEEYKSNFMIVNEYSRPILLKNRASQHLTDRGRTVENRHWYPNSKNARNIVWTYFYMEKYNTLHGKNPFYNAENWSFQMAKELFLDTAKIPPAGEEWNRISTLKFKF